MSYKPDEATLIDYLYGQLSPEESKQVERYLKANPNEELKLAGLENTRKILSAYTDKEIIAPAVLSRDEKRMSSLFSTSHIRWMVGMAASISLLMLIGYFTDLRVNFSASELTIRFGDVRKQSPAEVITMDKLESVMAKALEKNRQSQVHALDNLRAELKLQDTDNERQRKEELYQLVNEYFDSQKLDLEKYTGSLEQSNINIMDEYFTSASIQQQAYVKSLLIDFTKYLDEQRLQDREFYLNRLIDLKISSDLKQQETEQLLTSIINTVNNLPNEGSTQNF